MDYGYELREEGCFNITLNSYSPLYNDIGNFIPNCEKEIERHMMKFLVGGIITYK